MTPHFHSLQIADIRQETDDTISVAFTIPADLKSDFIYSAGQYLTLRATIDGKDTRRSYSICSAPHEQEWRVAIKRVEQGLFSNWAANELIIGQSLEVMSPMGNFKLTPNETSKKSYLLLASGSGITPILAITKTILTQEPLSDVTLVYGNKGFGTIIFREELEGLKNSFVDRFNLIHVLSRESLGNPLQKGRIDAEKIDKLCAAFFHNRPIEGVYICGPEEMILGVKSSLEAFGIAPEIIHFELFGTTVKKKVSVEDNQNQSHSTTKPAHVTVILDGDHIELKLHTDGLSVLDAATEAGADLPYACKGGVCCTCKARILEGTASMDLNYALEKEEVEMGYVLTCQAHPTSEKLIISFDD